MIYILSISLTLNIFLFFGVLGGIIKNNELDRQFKEMRQEAIQLEKRYKLLGGE